MDYQNFIEWLKTDHGMGERSARDVLSRLKRVIKITNATDVDENTVALLEICEEFANASSFIKSQLKRSVILYTEFMTANEEN